jgi:hypothetical protein
MSKRLDRIIRLERYSDEQGTPAPPGLRILVPRLAADEIRSFGPRAAARIEERLRIVRAAGWEGARSAGMIRDLGRIAKGIFEIRVTGRGEAYRLLCFATGDGSGRIVVVAGCVQKSRLLGSLRMKEHVLRAALRRDEWMAQNPGGVRR